MHAYVSLQNFRRRRLQNCRNHDKKNFPLNAMSYEFLDCKPEHPFVKNIDTHVQPEVDDDKQGYSITFALLLHR